MPARSLWNGTVRFGKIGLPVKLLSAVEDKTVRFHFLHDRDEQRVTQRFINPDKGDEVRDEEIRKGYEVEPGVFVVLDDAELSKLEPAPSKDIEITRFIPLTPSPDYSRSVRVR